MRLGPAVRTSVVSIAVLVLGCASPSMCGLMPPTSSQLFASFCSAWEPTSRSSTAAAWTDLGCDIDRSLHRRHNEFTP